MPKEDYLDPMARPAAGGDAPAHSGIVGMEWLVDARGCVPTLLADPVAIERICGRILSDLDLHVVGDGRIHQFPDPGGITALYLLTESHLACHTYPEHGAATFNLYCCRTRPVWPWKEHLAELLGAGEVEVRCVSRGGMSAAALPVCLPHLEEGR